jgi:hypothetical protein
MALEVSRAPPGEDNKQEKIEKNPSNPLSIQSPSPINNGKLLVPPYPER